MCLLYLVTNSLSTDGERSRLGDRDRSISMECLSLSSSASSFRMDTEPAITLPLLDQKVPLGHKCTFVTHGELLHCA